MTRAEVIEKLLADVETVLEELKAESLAKIAEAQARAERNIGRHDGAARELGDVGARLAALRSEREGLPVEHSRAVLNDDVDEELRLKDRASEVRAEIRRLESLASSLRDEVRRLNPRNQGHPSDATMHHLGAAAGVAHSARSDLEGLRERLNRALDGTVRPVAEKHDALRGTVEQLSRDRDWALSPAGRGGLRA